MVFPERVDTVLSRTKPWSEHKGWWSITRVRVSLDCNHCFEDQTAERVLQRYLLLQPAKQTVWPAAVQLHTKLSGSREGLEKAAAMILQFRLSAKRLRIKTLCFSVATTIVRKRN